MEKRFKERTKHYTFPEIMSQASEVSRLYSDVRIEVIGRTRTVNVYIHLSPTENSEVYIIKFSVQVGRKSVKVIPVKPHIGREVNGRKVPHMYKDGSLCLYYPKWSEWKYTDKWTETLVPWACLWLHYYEIWLVTDEWLGGGKHGAHKDESIDG